jgi:hypothetical protein
LANRANQEFKTQINPYIRLNRVSDTSVSLDHFVQIKSALHDQSFRYTDGSPRLDNLYRNYYYDSLKTKDSLHLRKFSNDVSYTVKTTKSGSGLSVGYLNEINQIYMRGDSVLMNNIAHAELSAARLFRRGDRDKEKVSSLSAMATAQYVVQGSNAGNYKGELKTGLLIDQLRKDNIYLNLLVEKRTPDLFFLNYLSNHYKWTNRFKTVDQLQASAGAGLWDGLEVSATWKQAVNLIYFDNSAFPSQYSSAVTNIALSAAYTHVFFRHLGLSFNYINQNTSAPSIVRLPPNIYTARLFYAGLLFKGNLNLQFGAQVQIYDSFKPYSFVPATQAFYLQNTAVTEQYPYVDVYLNARIRPVTVFLKVENLLQGFAGNGYYLVPGYYQPDRTLRMGINWIFFD